MKKFIYLLLGVSAMSLSACNLLPKDSGEEDDRVALAGHLPTNVAITILDSMTITKIGDDYYDSTLRTYSKKQSNGSYKCYSYDPFEMTWNEEDGFDSEDDLLSDCMINFVLAKWDGDAYFLNDATYVPGADKTIAGKKCKKYSYQYATYSFDYFVTDEWFTLEYSSNVSTTALTITVTEWDETVTTFPVEVPEV